jgi:predicted dehydrogenase
VASNQNNTGISRRDFGKGLASVAAASALAGIAIPTVHAAVSTTVQVALVGCGGRGSGAANDALGVKAAPMKLTAMADVFPDRLKSSYLGLSGGQHKDKVDVPEANRFIGFQAYKKAMDTLKAGDVVILATPLAFRAPMFKYAIEKGLNVFMEKPLSADGAKSREILKLADEASKKNLKCGVGLMSRHARPLQELEKRIRDGAVGDIVLMRGYRMADRVVGMGSFASTIKPPNMSELEYQIRRFHSFMWAGGGCYSDFNIHIVDHLCWMKGAWPVKAQGVGGRHFKNGEDGKPWVDQNFDSYGTEFTFADGSKMLFDGRCMKGAENIYSSYVHGTKGTAIASKSGDCGAPSSLYKGLGFDEDNLVWKSTDKSNPYQNEWNDLVDAIINDKPYNEVPRGVQASVVTSMGRAACHIGHEITYDQMLNSDHEFAPGIENLPDIIKPDQPGFVMPDEKGFYPQPQPGMKKREY